MWKQGERILDSDQFIERYQPAGRQPRGCGALPDLWLPDNTTARGLREAETALFVLKLTGKSCVVPVKMDIFISADQMGVTSTGPRALGHHPLQGGAVSFCPSTAVHCRFSDDVRATLALVYSEMTDVPPDV